MLHSRAQSRGQSVGRQARIQRDEGVFRQKVKSWDTPAQGCAVAMALEDREHPPSDPPVARPKPLGEAEVRLQESVDSEQLRLELLRRQLVRRLVLHQMVPHLVALRMPTLHQLDKGERQSTAL